ncbi:MAG: hypothetical protein E4H36_07830 [Spirochaetales bacterium]|nr:MAG: hypothetical protein E4H36_07830 [Spirochaetales bacterium]
MKAGKMKHPAEGRPAAGKPVADSMVSSLIFILLTVLCGAVLYGSSRLYAGQVRFQDMPLTPAIADILPAAVIFAFPLLALRRKKGSRILTAILILCFSFIILYSVLPAAADRPAPGIRNRTLNTASSRPANPAGSFAITDEGFLFTGKGKTVFISSAADQTVRITEGPPPQVPAGAGKSILRPFGPAVTELGTINSFLLARLSAGRSFFAFYLFSLLVFCTGALLLSSSSPWPAFNFFICAFFVKLLLLLHRFFKSVLFTDLETFIARFTSVHAVSFVLSVSGALLIFLGLFTLVSRTRRTP